MPRRLAIPLRNVLPPSFIFLSFQAIVDILQNYGWTYTTLIYNDVISYGINGRKALEEAHDAAGFCLSDPIALHPGEMRAEVYDDVVNRLIQWDIKGIVMAYILAKWDLTATEIISKDVNTILASST